jgi:hypothetical protein
MLDNTIQQFFVERILGFLFLIEMRDAFFIQVLLNNTEEIASHCLSSLMENSEV